MANRESIFKVGYQEKILAIYLIIKVSKLDLQQISIDKYAPGISLNKIANLSIDEYREESIKKIYSLEKIILLSFIMFLKLIIILFLNMCFRRFNNT